MIKSIATTGTQVVILMILILIGYACGKRKVLNDEAVDSMSTIALMIASPCTIIESFVREYDAGMAKGMLFVVLITFVVHAIAYFVSKLTFRGNDARSRVLRFEIIFGNCGYMGIPLVKMILGSTGVFYGGIFLGIFNIIIWTLGIVLMSGDNKDISIKKLINPNIIAVFVGALIFLLSIPVPDIVLQPIKYMSSLFIPIPMMVIGYCLSKISFAEIFTQLDYYIVCLMRLIIVPIILLGLLYIIKVDKVIALCCIISSAVPASASSSMMTILYKQDYETAANIVSVSTVLSIITLPIVIGIAQMMF